MSTPDRPRIVVLDHLDSFVHNLARYLTLANCQPIVLRADEVTCDECLDLAPDGILLSPGPKGPSETPVAIEIISRTQLAMPILGVCLGHQAIAAAIGANVIVGPPMHGIADTITHDQDGVFKNCDNPIRVGRYHSLIVDPSSLPPQWSVTATTADAIVMGIRHKDGYVEGVQFHPESILTSHGQTMINNFVDLCRRSAATKRASVAKS